MGIRRPGWFRGHLTTLVITHRPRTVRRPVPSTSARAGRLTPSRNWYGLFNLARSNTVGSTKPACWTPLANSSSRSAHQPHLL
jgi:hypothetical protein